MVPWVINWFSPLSLRPARFASFCLAAVLPMAPSSRADLGDCFLFDSLNPGDTRTRSRRPCVIWFAGSACFSPFLLSGPACRPVRGLQLNCPWERAGSLRAKGLGIHRELRQVATRQSPTDGFRASVNPRKPSGEPSSWPTCRRSQHPPAGDHPPRGGNPGNGLCT